LSSLMKSTAVNIPGGKQIVEGSMCLDHPTLWMYTLIEEKQKRNPAKAQKLTSCGDAALPLHPRDRRECTTRLCIRGQSQGLSPDGPESKSAGSGRPESPPFPNDA
jgi:hypothetical protein